MTQFVRTADEHFANLPNFHFAPNYHSWQDLRMHYLDEGPKDGPVMLLLHGMPTWSFLYRDVIPVLVARAIAVLRQTTWASDDPINPRIFTGTP